MKYRVAYSVNYCTEIQEPEYYGHQNQKPGGDHLALLKVLLLCLNHVTSRKSPVTIVTHGFQENKK